MDPSISFQKHCNYVTYRIDKRNNILNALAGSSCGQERETLLLTYNALGKSIASYAAPVWSTNASDSSFKKIQTAQNAALRTATGAHTMDSIDHFHQESLTMKVKDHSDMLSVQYLVNCLEEDHVCHGITTQEPRPRPMKESLHSRHHSTVLPRLGASRKKTSRIITHTRYIRILSSWATTEYRRSAHPQYRTSRDLTEDNDALSHSNDQDTAIYYRTTSIRCSANHASFVQTVELHHKM